jgi:hypothetical protein
VAKATVDSPGSHHGHRDALRRPRVSRRLRPAACCWALCQGPGPGRLARRWRVPPERSRNCRSLLRGVRRRISPCGCLPLPLSVSASPSSVRVQSPLCTVPLPCTGIINKFKKRGGKKWSDGGPTQGRSTLSKSYAKVCFKSFNSTGSIAMKIAIK